jgi:uncharacterized membrane protein
MTPIVQKRPSKTAEVVFDLLNPIPYGFFVGALIFDIVYTNSPDVMWVKSAAWLIAIGLFFAIVPRFINLFQVWWPRAIRTNVGKERGAFWLNLLGIVVAIVNAFVHSRDAYGVVPEGVWLSALTVALLALGNVLVSLQHSNHVNTNQA